MAITNKLTDIADAIRDKTGTINKYNLVGMAETIQNIQGSSGEDGGYYMPVVSQATASTMTIAFTASKSSMPVVSSSTVILPTSSNTVIEAIEISEV